jgi:hypothetical protein
MSMSAKPPPDDADKLAEESKESIGKVREMVDELKTVQEHENAVIDPEVPPSAAQ